MTDNAPELAVPPELRRTLGLLALLSGGANVVMQLSRLPIGHGVAESVVESGRVDRHPIKRLRTTCTYVSVAMLGDEDERRTMRLAVSRVHRHVRSSPGEPVAYSALDPQLQLWVAACLYVGVEDVHTRLYGALDETRREVLYNHGKLFGTTLQVRPEMWPATREDFERYWRAGLAEARMDELTRSYLQSVADFTILLSRLGRAAPLAARIVRPVGWTISGGFLPAELRDELGLPWTRVHQRAFDAFLSAAVSLTRAAPPALQGFPFNAYLWYARRRLRQGRPLV